MTSTSFYAPLTKFPRCYGYKMCFILLLLFDNTIASLLTSFLQEYSITPLVIFQSISNANGLKLYIWIRFYSGRILVYHEFLHDLAESWSFVKFFHGQAESWGFVDWFYSLDESSPSVECFHCLSESSFIQDLVCCNLQRNEHRTVILFHFSHIDYEHDKLLYSLYVAWMSIQCFSNRHMTF